MIYKIYNNKINELRDKIDEIKSLPDPDYRRIEDLVYQIAILEIESINPSLYIEDMDD